MGHGALLKMGNVAIVTVGFCDVAYRMVVKGVIIWVNGASRNLGIIPLIIAFVFGNVWRRLTSFVVVEYAKTSRLRAEEQ